MIHVAPQPEPANFDLKVRQPGLDFLRKISDFDVSNFKKSLHITDVMLQPDAYSFAEIIDDIQLRDKSIRQELEEFISGVKRRKDLADLVTEVELVSNEDN